MQRYEEIIVQFNAREIIIPLFRVGAPEAKPGELLRVWETFKDWKRGNK